LRARSKGILDDQKLLQTFLSPQKTSLTANNAIVHDNLPSWKEGFACRFNIYELCFANYMLFIFAYTGSHTA